MPPESWPLNYTVRAPLPDEAQLVADLICACDTADTGEPDWDVEETRADWQRLGFDMTRDARVVVAPDGRLAAYTDVFVRPNAVQIASNTCLNPEFRSPDLHQALIGLAEWLAAQHAPLPIQWIVAAPQGPVLEARGYAANRWLWRMRADFLEAPAAPRWPEGFAVRTMRTEDEPRAYELIEEAFVRPGRAHVTYEEWRRFIVERDDFDRSLAFLATHGEQVVGTAMCLMYGEAEEGWVRQLAVDSRYRGRGLGRALLLHAFGEFYRRGARRAGLGVDANNPSATKLYLGVGMHSLQEYVQYERPASA